MRLLGIDYGRRRIGLALASEGVVAPLRTLKVTSDEQAIAQITALCQEHRIDRIVLGLPVRLDGSSSAMTRRVKRFGRQLAGETGLSVLYSEEQLTTKAADRLLSQMGRQVFRDATSRRDQAAATIILKDYLDSV